MFLHNSTADVFVPDNVPLAKALARATHVGVVAHQDDLEILAFEGIAKCYKGSPGFLGVVITDGRGSPREGDFASFTDEEMRQERRQEQRRAAEIGRYSAVLQLDYPSALVRKPHPDRPGAVEDLVTLFSFARPHTVYTHSIFDQHVGRTHVAVPYRLVEALRMVPPSRRPKQVVGCEVWGGLDWLPASVKVTLDVSGLDALAVELLGVFRTQIAGGKRYDLATVGRRQANATFNESDKVDRTTALIVGIDMTSLINDSTLDVEEFVAETIDEFKSEIMERLYRVHRPTALVAVL